MTFEMSKSGMLCVPHGIPRHGAGNIGAIPIDLLAVESADIRAGSTGVETAESLRKRCRELTIAKWQQRWVNSIKGRWTYKHIPELQRWLGRKHGHVDFYLDMDALNTTRICLSMNLIRTARSASRIMKTQNTCFLFF